MSASRAVLEATSMIGGETVDAERAFHLHVLDSTRTLAKGLAHDINSPLQILNDATFLLREALDAIEATAAPSAVEGLREAGDQAALAFDQLRDLSKALAQIVPPAASDGAQVRLEVELGIVRALTRFEWHRDIALTLDCDPRINVSGVPRPLLRQLLIDLVLFAARDVIDAQRSNAYVGPEKRPMVVRATSDSGRIVVEIAAQAPAGTKAPRDHRFVRSLSYEPLLSPLGITVELGLECSRVELPAAASQEGMFI